MMPPRRSAGGTMKMRGLLFVGLCVLCIRQHVRADDGVSPGLKDSLTNKVAVSAAGALGTKPVELLIEDAYPVLLRDGLKNMYQAVKSSLLTLIYGDIEEVSDMVMAELQAYLFGTSRVQKKMWRKLRNTFRDYLRDWWLKTLLDPYETLKTGVWQALLKLTADDLPVVMGGTPEYEKMKELLLDEKAEVIGRWVQRIKRNMMQGVDQQQDERVSSQKRGPLRGKFIKQEAGKTPTNEGSDSTVGGDTVGGPQ
eukprot:XP_028356620.1 uncharacterized protein LOC114487934 [Physeter catodon]